uniref:Uncharacterized protein n=1 Tax=Rhizobium rhizogenes TaxID=359 RepID=A0A4P8DKG9_RHIRH|nr:hypothetical protein pTiC5.7_60 [Rhizobium rhizogenes]QCL10904.1 hypothetical protein pTiC6.5_60 [Rhizobium rhizogenes]
MVAAIHLILMKNLELLMFGTILVRFCRLDSFLIWEQKQNIDICTT